MIKINKKIEIILFTLIYVLLFTNAILNKDSIIAFVSAFCGITYTILAGKGVPMCYPIGATGSCFYAYLSFVSNLWGNLLLYVCYYIPMQILGFFQWNKNLKSDKYEIVKTVLKNKERVILFLIATLITIVTIFILAHFGDKNPIIDGITTVFSVLGMYLTVKRTIEQWIVWMLVNGLSFLMWLDILLHGEKVYSTVFMWLVYFILAVYFYISWKKEITAHNHSNNS